MKVSKTPFNVPAGATAQISIIDTTSRLRLLEVNRLLTPPMEGLEHMPEMPSWSFLIENASGLKVLFDLGVSLDWRDYAPIVSNRLTTNGWDIIVKKSVAEILKEHDIQPESVSSIIWSHWHWDHLGDPSAFPSSTEVVVGPGFKEALLPAWPSGPDSPVREKDFHNRNLREIAFDQDLNIGDFRAFDFFGDGSFYLLDTPGHAVGHLGGLIRTTENPDTFIFLGGDLCHHGGEIRPSEHLPIPKDITPHPFGITFPPACPGACFEELLTKRSRSLRQPFFDPARGLSVEEAISTIKRSQVADARDNILFIFAHDPSVWQAAELFPLKANDWKKKGWREKMLWDFLKDFKDIVGQR